MAMTIEEFRSEMMEDLRLSADYYETDTEDIFLNDTFETLSESGAISDPVRFYFGKNGRRNRMMQLHGYAYDLAEGSLSLIISYFKDSNLAETLTQTQIDTLCKRLLNFLSVGGKIDCFKGKKASSVACKEILKKEILQNIVVQTEVALKNDQRCRNSLAPKEDKCKRVDVFLCADKNRKDAIRKTSFIIGIFIFLTNLQPIPVAPNMSKKSGKTKNIRNINMRPKKNHFSLPPDGRLNCNRNFPKNIGRTTFTFIKPAANGQWI